MAIFSDAQDKDFSAHTHAPIEWRPFIGAEKVKVQAKGEKRTAYWRPVYMYERV